MNYASSAVQLSFFSATPFCSRPVSPLVTSPLTHQRALLSLMRVLEVGSLVLLGSWAPEAEFMLASAIGACCFWKGLFRGF